MYSRRCMVACSNAAVAETVLTYMYITHLTQHTHTKALTIAKVGRVTGRTYTILSAIS